MPKLPDLKLETAIIRETGCRHIAGLDEAGRGALAGPVAAAAVILPLHAPQTLKQLAGVNDSKRLTAAVRQRLYTAITKNALAYGVGLVAAEQIDRTDIVAATQQAMGIALSRLSLAADYLLIDGRLRLPHLAIPQQAVIRGDSQSLTIAAASILAKVTRDRHMIELDATYPQYGLARHKGYGTRQHLEALARYGPAPIHRYSFAPIRQKRL